MNSGVFSVQPGGWFDPGNHPGPEPYYILKGTLHLSNPDVGDVIRGLAAEGAAAIVVVPIGFVCDHVEVLYDLDVEARGIAAGCGVAFHRAATVSDHPAYVGMLADLVREASGP